MSKTTWNFPTWWSRDTGPASARNAVGHPFECGPGGGGVGAPYNTQPFSESITAIFSLFDRTGWSPQTYVEEGIFSIGVQSAAQPAFYLYTEANRLKVRVWDGDTTTMRHEISLGDESGGDLLADKWYQFGISVNATGISYCVNGSNTPSVVITTDTPGGLNLDNGSERVWVHAPPCNSGVGDPLGIGSGWVGYVFGPKAFAKTKLDFSDVAVRNRIWDSDGNFKSPGENGSWWFNDTYATSGAYSPQWFFTDGSPRYIKGSTAQGWGVRNGGGAGYTSYPGGLRKQYE